ncbi:MAG: lysylphosphatidylglycerol synthase transmembrane domain-containing protein [Nanoarchaeota archaeon]|mgnify:CR=1 FL=1
MKKTIKRYVLPLIGVIIFIVFLRHVPSRDILLRLRDIGLVNIIILLTLTSADLFLKSIRWKLLISKTTSIKIPLFFSFKTILAGIASGSIIPGRVELTRPLMLKANYEIPLASSIPALTTERIMDLISLLFIMIASALLISSTKNIVFLSPAIISMIVLGVLGILIIAFYPHWLLLAQKTLNSIFRARIFEKIKIRGALNYFFDSYIQSISKLKKSYISSMTIFSCIINGIEIIRFYFLLQMLGIDASLAATGFAFTASIIIGIATMIPGGVGVTEVSASQIITSMTPTATKGIVASAILLERVIAYYLLVILGALILTFSVKSER